MKTDIEIVEIARKSYEEAKSSISGWNAEAHTDMKFYLSDQWDSKDEAKLKKKGIPVLVLNYIKKTIDLISGYQRQNRSDIKYFPIEGGDKLVAEVLSKVALWAMKSNNSRYYISEAFKDALITGIGWFYPEIDYSRDPIAGDFKVCHESSFNMLFDPYFTKLDLSDASYVIRHKLLHRSKTKELWPEKEKEIEKQPSAKGDSDFRQDVSVPGDQGNMVLVWEYWYRDTELKTFAIDQEGKMVEVKDDESLDAYKQSKDITLIERKMPVMKVAIMVGESTGRGKPIVVFHDYSPYNTNDFPFVPIFGYLTSSFSEWDKKLQGLIRPLRDPQREKNKRRSGIMHMFNTVASSGYDMEKGAYDDINAFRTGGAGKIHQRNRGFNPAMRLPTPEMPASAIQLEQMFTNDISIIGANPDLLGQMNEKNAPGITIQLRQKQGMTALQEVFDNLSMAIQKFGRILVELMVGTFDRRKIERILGEEVPFKMEIQQLSQQLEQMKQQLTQGAQDLQQMAVRETPDEKQYQQMEKEEQAIEQQLMQMNVQFQQGQQQLQQLQEAEADFWERWKDLGVNSYYDCSVSETIENETYRISVLSALLQAQQYNMPVPPELILEYLDIPEEEKDKMRQFVQQQQQQAQQMAEQKMQLEEKKVQNQKEIELIKQGVSPVKQQMPDQMQ